MRDEREEYVRQIEKSLLVVCPLIESFAKARDRRNQKSQ